MEGIRLCRINSGALICNRSKEPAAYLYIFCDIIGGQSAGFVSEDRNR